MSAQARPSGEPSAAPERGLGFFGALSANVLNMVGIGPFITIPLALAAMGGPQALIGWVLGAVLCLCDGMVWAELGSAMPQSGGPYHYLREAFGPQRLGRLFGFLFLWQSLLIGPMSIASGAVGFAQYATVLAPGLKPWQLCALAAGVCLLNTAILYRRVRSLEPISILVSLLVVAACGWIVLTGVVHFSPGRAFGGAPPLRLDHGFWMGLGAATLISVYDYGGYNNVCLIGGEVRDPRRNIPRAVIVSILLIGALYLAMNLSILGGLGWKAAAASKTVAADLMGAVYGGWGSRLLALFILVACWGSVLAVLLGNSRIPYAAAADGEFFALFARLHPKGGFPTVSLLAMGGLSALACLIPLDALIAVLILIQTMFQYIAQCFAVVALRRRGGKRDGVFRMPFYPVPIVVTLAGWSYIVATSPLRNVAIAAALLVLGAIVYLVGARPKHAWPFQPA